ncbi:MAG: hypothetical protein LBC82_03640 [Oscillospiraceae bacterium]|jgi:hypothetical protein|nr:hypothetical protein [Oscillospiraceae bacterium]
MQSKYGDLSAAELRELCLKDELDAAQMSLEELEKLFGYESELDDPQAEILIFCSKGFDKFDKYRKDIRKPSLKKIYRENNIDERRRATKPALRVLKMAATIAIIITLTAFTAQAVVITCLSTFVIGSMTGTLLECWFMSQMMNLALTCEKFVPLPPPKTTPPMNRPKMSSCFLISSGWRILMRFGCQG